jgi:hypothetical protein
MVVMENGKLMSLDSLAAVNFFLGTVGTVQLSRIFMYSLLLSGETNASDG